MGYSLNNGHICYADRMEKILITKTRYQQLSHTYTPLSLAQSVGFFILIKTLKTKMKSQAPAFHLRLRCIGSHKNPCEPKGKASNDLFSATPTPTRNKAFFILFIE